MIDVSVNRNSVYVPMVQTGYFKAEFDSTYPIDLNGIISQDEFRESINRINRAYSSNRCFRYLGIVFGINIIGGMVLFMFGVIRAFNSDTFGFPSLSSGGLVLFSFGSMFIIMACIVIQFRRTTRMREAIAEESMKYSSRSPTPCSWIVETTTYFVTGHEDQYNRRVLYYLAIVIDRSDAPGSGAHYSNQAAPESTLLSERQNNSMPPPYSGPYDRFCSQCGATRQDLSVKFCSSCGHSFNKL